MSLAARLSFPADARRVPGAQELLGLRTLTRAGSETSVEWVSSPIWRGVLLTAARKQHKRINQAQRVIALHAQTRRAVLPCLTAVSLLSPCRNPATEGICIDQRGFE